MIGLARPPGEVLSVPSDDPGALVRRPAVHDDVFDLRVILLQNRADGCFEEATLVEGRCDDGYEHEGESASQRVSESARQ